MINTQHSSFQQLNSATAGQLSSSWLSTDART
jgi:hypothetical protein